MFENTQAARLQKRIATHTTLSFLVGSVVWVALLLQAAAHVRNQTGGGDATVAFGPLQLSEISKQPIEGGYNIAITLTPGMLWYAVMWILIGIAASIAAIWLPRLRKENTAK